MVEKGLSKLYLGFIFIMLSFRIQGFDIFPDVVGYVLFAFAFRDLNSRSEFFSLASKYNIALIVLSIFSIYQRPTQAEGIHFGSLGILGAVIGIVVVVLNLLVVYNIFMGIHDVAYTQEQYELAEASQKKWKLYLTLQIAVWMVLILIFIPILALIYTFAIFAATIIITISIINFINKCSRELN
ncbi:hypothetical protein [Clostridium sp. YIM B02551]|uniref:hypothetical protein n=1 Tax=Clostridium sp. YIM B02551 TaxID=2910679 RepID=UPI001EEBD3FF|nr:hypothetical protein [Clostridium sp. YIM B02551]